MKQRITHIIASFMLMLGLVAFVAVPAGAAPVDVFKNCPNNGGNATVCGNNGDKLFDIIKNVINVMLYAAGIIAVIMIIIGGINYAISSGDNAKVTSAKNAILYAVVGLIIAALAYAIVNFVIANIF